MGFLWRPGDAVGVSVRAPLQGFDSFGAGKPRAWPWAALGCPVGADGGGWGRMGGGWGACRGDSLDCFVEGMVFDRYSSQLVNLKSLVVDRIRWVRRAGAGGFFLARGVFGGFRAGTPAGVRAPLGCGSGGVALLNHRLLAEMPPASCWAGVGIMLG